MTNKRLQYLMLILSIVAAGIISRKISFLPLFIGDVLYSVMIYFIFRMLLLTTKSSQIALFTLIFCIAIECSQLYQANWIIALRKTFLGHHLLGQEFLWSDLIAYFFGATTAFYLDKKIKLNTTKTKIFFKI